jgi:putative metallopeptidase DUF4344
MRRLLVALVLLHAVTARADGELKVVYGEVKNKTSEELAAALKKGGTMELLAKNLNTLFKLPRDVPIVLMDCGAPNAWYFSEKHAIIVCYELMEHFIDLLQHQTAVKFASGNDLGRMVGEQTVFALFHELCHALIGELEPPATGREEDAVDEFATLLLTGIGEVGEQAAASGAFWFVLEAEHRGEKPPVFWDEHSFDMQRLGTIVCLLYGHHPEKFASMMAKLGIPEARQKRCIAEFPKKKASWQALLKPHMKVQEGKSWP